MYRTQSSFHSDQGTSTAVAVVENFTPLTQLQRVCRCTARGDCNDDADDQRAAPHHLTASIQLASSVSSSVLSREHGVETQALSKSTSVLKEKGAKAASFDGLDVRTTHSKL